MAKKNVSVLMTVYNGLPYLKEAIDSILTQTYTDFELLIINDASPDASAALIESYQDSRIRLLHNDHNLGQVGSLNRGLQEAKGDLIARIDQDDISLPNRLAKQVAEFDRNPDLAVVGSWGYRIDSNSKRIGTYRERSSNFGAYLANLLLTRCPILHPSVMFKKDVAIENGGYDRTYAPAEDYNLWTRLAARGHRGFVIQEALVMVRSHGGQQSAAKAATQLHNNTRAHHNMVEQFCRPQDASAVTALLRMDWEFWKECDSKARILAALDGLDFMIENMSTTLQLSPEDTRALRRILYIWIGPGARFRNLLRPLPSFAFYPAFVTLCPLLIPNARVHAARVFYGTQKLWNRGRS